MSISTSDMRDSQMEEQRKCKCECSQTHLHLSDAALQPAPAGSRRLATPFDWMGPAAALAHAAIARRRGVLMCRCLNHSCHSVADRLSHTRSHTAALTAHSLAAPRFGRACTCCIVRHGSLHSFPSHRSHAELEKRSIGCRCCWTSGSGRRRRPFPFARSGSRSPQRRSARRAAYFVCRSSAVEECSDRGAGRGGAGGRSGRSRTRTADGDGAAADHHGRPHQSEPAEANVSGPRTAVLLLDETTVHLRALTRHQCDGRCSLLLCLASPPVAVRSSLCHRSQ